MKSFGFVYKHTNRINGKVYVGQSTEPAHRRWRKGDKNYNSYKTCPAFYPALVKYTWEAFESEILVWTSNLETLNKLEEFYIKIYNCIAPNGYNTQSISNGRGKQAESTKEKISQKQLEHNQNQRDLGIVKIAVNRKDHKVIEGIELKHCVGNDKKSHWVPVTEFGQYQRTWDHLHNKCRKCHNEYVHKQTQGSRTLLTKEEMKQSYKDRSVALSEGQKRRKQNNPESLMGGKKNAKAIVRIDVNTGDTKEYNSGLEAKADGFDNTYVSQACKTGKLFKGYRWIFKNNT